MWYLKFMVKHKGCIYSPYTKKFGITDFTYPMGHVLKGDEVHLSAIHVLQGPPAGVRKYITYLKKHPDILRIEGAGNVFFTLATEKVYPEEYQAVYNPELIFVAPIINGKDGCEIWQLASWNREPLQELIALSKRSSIVIEFRLLEFRRKVIHDVYVASLVPKLSPQQFEALRIAYEEGFYQFPKKTDLNQLARMMKKSKATVQEHLKKAEAKMMPFLLQRHRET